MTSDPTTAPRPTPAAPGPTAPTLASEPVHGCVRCGARIPVSESMCERCNPLGLKPPAASQAHGTVFLAIGLAVVALAIGARLAVAGVGPFSGDVTNVAAASDGLRVTLAITNEGTSSSRTTCRVDDPAIRGIGPEAAYVQTPRIDGGATVTFDTVVTSLGTEPRPLSVACGGE